MKAKRKRSIEEILEKIRDVRDEYPSEYSDKIYDAVTVYEGIEEVGQVGIRKGIEMAILIIEAESEGEK